MFSDVRQRMRQRQLAGDGRAGSWARTKMREPDSWRRADIYFIGELA
jgi:hypothetical protein